MEVSSFQSVTLILESCCSQFYLLNLIYGHYFRFDEFSMKLDVVVLPDMMLVPLLFSPKLWGTLSEFSRCEEDYIIVVAMQHLQQPASCLILRGGFLIQIKVLQTESVLCWTDCRQDYDL